MALRMPSSFSPAGPANGCPLVSSKYPGASLMKTMSADGFPPEKTSLSRRVPRVLAAGQFWAWEMREAICSCGVDPVVRICWGEGCCDSLDSGLMEVGWFSVSEVIFL